MAALTFAVMIGSFYLAEQYLQRAAGFSALGASAVLVVVALLVGVAAPIAGRLVDEHGERVPAMAGFLAAGGGLCWCWAIPGVPLDSAVTILPLIPVGLGLGMLFVPTSRAPRSTPHRSPPTAGLPRCSPSGACSVPRSARGLRVSPWPVG